MSYLVLLLASFLAITWASPAEPPVDYTGHRVITVIPGNENELEFIKELGDKYKLDLWSEPREANLPVMIRLRPSIIEKVEKELKEARIDFVVAIFDLQSAIQAERTANAPMPDLDRRVSHTDLSKYLTLTEINQFLQGVALNNPNVATINIGNTYENRPIMGAKIGSDETKPVVLMECGIHAREWVSVSSCLYTINVLTSKFASDPSIRKLVTDYQWYIIPSSNPDGYEYTWTSDRMWRKTRSLSKKMVFPWCRGADANRNFDIDHCGAGTSKDPCEDIYCGDEPFSESESRALRDLIQTLGNRIKVYFAVHSFSQLWMTPYGYTRKLPPNYSELMRVCQIATAALKVPYQTVFKCGPIANIIYPAAGSSLDWAYDKAGVKNGFALELRDTGRHGFMLPKDQILPTCEETWAGIKAAVNAL